ncbi:divergent PAP2 family protein [candidate division WOR-3 bacterium]|jgi:acid phosphatase family membrane protein YuiD|nr:divergent PAP2 family protein [candidate division WOR-3 bacterium]
MNIPIGFKIILVSMIASFIAQLSKFFSYIIEYRKIDFVKLYNTGGMPSAHSSSVMAITTLIGITQGFFSPLFGVTFCFSFIVMYDAAGLRRAAGHQARALNTIIQKGEIDNIGKLVDQLGHTPFEVLMGIILGILTAGVFL